VNGPDFRPDLILAVLERHDVEYVVIGGFAGILHGSPHLTRDVDVCPRFARDNLSRLAAALEELDAHIRAYGVDEPLAFDRSAEFLEKCQVWNLATSFGDLDLSVQPSGTAGYDDLKRDAVVIEIRGMVVCVASLADIVRSKEAAGRDKDRITLPTLRAMLERQERG
jgi:hypothetical protein